MPFRSQKNFFNKQSDWRLIYSLNLKDSDMAVRKIKLTLSYDGLNYHGWQFQPDAVTIQGNLNIALAKLFGQSIETTGASRTDAGVSAIGQSVCFETDSPIPTANFVKAINGFLEPEIAVTNAIEVSPDFNVISDVSSKSYRYNLFISPVRPVLERHNWHLRYTLDVKKMNIALQHLVGQHDFKSFASAADQRQSSIRTIFNCAVTSNGSHIVFDIAGDGFLYNMVRNIVGTMVEVGRGRLAPEAIPQILSAKDRTAAGPIAPANGLVLQWIKYNQS